jgi:hypothetical protein
MRVIHIGGMNKRGGSIMIYYEKIPKAEIKWWERVILWFKPKKITDNGLDLTIEFKWLFGRMYVIREYRPKFKAPREYMSPLISADEWNKSVKDNIMEVKS